MKNKSIIILMFISTIVYGQWVNSFNINTTSTTISYDICFTTEKDGMCFNNEYHNLSPSSSYGSVGLNTTSDGAVNWLPNSAGGSWSHGPIIYTLQSDLEEKTIYKFNSWEGLYSISKTPNNGVNWQFLKGGTGWHRSVSIVDSLHFFYLYKGLNNVIYLNKYSNYYKGKVDSFSLFTPYIIKFTDSITGYVTASLNSIYANRHHVYKTSSGGNNWSQIFSSNLVRINNIIFPTRNTGYIVADSGKIFKTINSGLSWQNMNTNTSLNLLSGYFINDSIGYVCGDTGLIMKTIDGGLNWTTQITGTNNRFQKIFFVNDSVGFAVSGTNVYKINSSIMISVNELNSINNDLKLFPNPIIDKLLNLYMSNQELNTEKKIFITITDIIGHNFRNVPYILGSNNLIQVPLNNFPSGLYNITVIIDNKSYNTKFVKE